MIDTIILIVFAGSVIVGAGLVWITYAGFERSVAAGGSAFLVYSVIAILVGRRLAQHIAWASWAQADMASLVTKLGAIIGATIIIVGYRPEYRSAASRSQTAEPSDTTRSPNRRSGRQED